MITFQKITSPEPVVVQLVDLITSKLQRGTLLWLVSGGSAVSVAVEISKALQGHSLSNLAVTLADERYGEVGHTDSNWQQLLDAGFSLPGARLLPVLNGGDRETTVQAWGEHLSVLLEDCDYKLALLGIGPDGHTSGILPGSEAVDADGLVVTYDGGGYQRVTTTPAALRQLDEAVVYAAGESKRPALQNLQRDLSVSEQPAQLLKTIPKVTVYNDEIGGA